MSESNKKMHAILRRWHEEASAKYDLHIDDITESHILSNLAINEALKEVQCMYCEETIFKGDEIVLCKKCTE